MSTDETGGLNRDGSIVLHVPPSHVAAVIDGERAGWLRARVVEADEGQPSYSASPVIHGLVADTIGGTIDAIHGDVIENEAVGTSEGVAGQRYRVQNTPVLGGAGAAVVYVSSDTGWEQWTEVQNRASTYRSSFRVRRGQREISFGPAVRTADGGLRQYGAIPLKADDPSRSVHDWRWPRWKHGAPRLQRSSRRSRSSPQWRIEHRHRWRRR